MLTVCNGCHVGFKHITSHLARSSACKGAYSFGFGGGGLVQHEQPHPVLLEHKRRERAALVARGLGDLRFEKGLGDSVIEPIKAFAAECNRPAKAGATAELCALHPALSPSAVAEILDLHFDHFNGLRTEKQEFAHYRATVPTVPVVEREVGDGHVVCDIPLLDNLERFLSNSPDEIVDKIIDTSTRLKAGMYLKDTGVIEDVFHGTVIKEHPAGQPSTDVKELRILVGGYTDGCEMANGMGPAAGEHELWCTSACILNLPPGERYEHDNLLLINVATNKAVGNATMTTIFSGADPTTGKVLVGHSSSPGAQLREHRRTISFIRHSVRVTFNMVVWMLFFSADNPAAGKMTSFPESTSAHLFCRGCLGDLREDDVKQPHDFFECAAGRCSFTAGRRRKNKVCGLKLRTPAITKASKKEILAAPNKTATQKLKSNKGISTIFPALSGELIPDFDEHKMVPFDPMHVEASQGTLSSEGYCVCNRLIKNGHMTWATFSELVDSIPTSPSNVRVRSLREVDITKCQTGGMPCRDSKLRLSAAETQYFALCSVNLFGPYVDRTKECSFWDSWVKHIEYLRIMLQPTIKVSDLVNMSALIKEHQTLFAQVPEYQEKDGDATKDKAHWKPKHHFSQHLPLDMLRLGPARGYWCYSYEGYNKVIKKIAKGSNFKNICKRVADVW